MMIVERQNDSAVKILDNLYPLIPEGDLKRYAKLFYHDLLAALSNQRSSLPTILNPIHKMEPKPGFGVAVSIGGTNGYVSAFRVSRQKKIKFLNRIIFNLPEQTNRQKLFHLISKNIFIAAKDYQKKFPIGIGFAYPLKPLLTHRYIDGELLFMSKGRTIRGLVGKRVGQQFHKFLIKEYGFDTTVAVANDAICLLLGGDGVDVAGVVGTGLNFAYWEVRSNIAPMKLGEINNFAQAEVAVNIETKNFDKIEGSKLRAVIDKSSDDFGYSFAEKEVAGAYLYRIFNAGKEKLLGKRFPYLKSTDQLNDIITNAYKYPHGIRVNDQQLAVGFAGRIFHRSAQIVAIELCGILMKIGKTKGIVPVVMEGGIFWKAKNYTTLVNLYVHMILPEIIPSFARLFGSSRRGIAILASGV